MSFNPLSLITALSTGILVPAHARKRLRAASRAFRRLASRPEAPLLVGLVAVLICVAVAAMNGLAVPAVHDEFCYLLGADTFAEGRLTNPTHPMWEHFESFHIIHHPTYQMKYPPGQAIFLALGQVLGHPILGVWISLGLACGATCWMMRAWLPPRWALIGAVLPLVNVTVMVNWGQSYWGGAVAMLGGALLFGGLPRVMRKPTTWHATLLAIGIVILATTRPYEGLVASLPAAGVLTVWFLRRDTVPFTDKFFRCVVPIMLVLVTGAAWMAYYNFRVTGDALKLPYQAWSATYGRDMGATMFGLEVRDSSRQRTLPLPPIEGTPVEMEYQRIRDRMTPKWRVLRQLAAYVGLVFLLPLAMVVFKSHSPKERFALLTLTSVLLAIVFQKTTGHPHYFAPAVPLMFFVVAEGLRRLAHTAWWGRGLVATTLAVSLLTVIPPALGHRNEVMEFHGWSLERAEIDRQLAATEAKNLVVVRYRRGHHLWREWVYNAADIDAAPVVWARELEPAQNIRLLEYFKDRQVWLLDADLNPPQLIRHQR